MNKAQSAWLSQRGQPGADRAVDHLLGMRPDEHIQQIEDSLIDDSPAQVREPFTEESLHDLVQSMQQAGFTGVLVVRPHPKERDRFELVFGHRRRAAWRMVCREAQRACLIPAIIRPVTDRDMLLQGATENLARADLSLREECALVVRLIHDLYPSPQEQIASLIGKTKGWMASRARVNGLPEALRSKLWQRPSAMSHFLELGTLYTSQPSAALALAERIVQEELTLHAVRLSIKESMTSDCAFCHNKAGTSFIVTESTILESRGASPSTTVHEHERSLPGKKLRSRALDADLDTAFDEALDDEDIWDPIDDFSLDDSNLYDRDEALLLEGNTDQEQAALLRLQQLLRQAMDVANILPAGEPFDAMRWGLNNMFRLVQNHTHSS